MENSKISLKLGALDIQFEGSEEFIAESLVAIVEQFVGLDLPDIAVGVGGAVNTFGSGVISQEVASPVQSKLSATDFAVKMSVKSGSDLVMAAAAYLYHTRGMEEFRRSDILSAMKEAKGFYKTSMGSNLSKSLETLVKSSRLQTPSSDTYTLPYSEVEGTGRHLS
ncbi:hypothetical protein SAMN05444851_0778 [Aliiroseovarius sediminilitoris]|uniref:Uncharacterized protein n=1 Tax=Aliiroseovarius sediminilitoris TaxID=1173584 RepID=A0A1I0NFA6_9RHOB|nr:hypothetical protein [Aliiroseovarius sediminilitoris]SEV99921.1 hypothetical protein SAMN05444851_0778 [Aliiroseovarius sediminilitoris]